MNEKQIKHIETVVAASGKLLDTRTNAADAEQLSSAFDGLLNDSTGKVYSRDVHGALMDHYSPAILDVATAIAGNDPVRAVLFIDMMAALVSEVAKRFYELGYLADREN